MTSSDERRDVAERIRAYGSGFDFGDSNPFWYVCKAVFGDVKARTYYDAFNRLADLIDPTCTSVMAKGKCSVCGEPLGSHANYCPNCGCRVVSDDD